MSTFSHDGRTWKVTTCTATKLVAVPVTGDELLAIREKMQLTTRDMAERLGISQSKLVKLENGTQWKSLGAVLSKAERLPKERQKSGTRTQRPECDKDAPERCLHFSCYVLLPNTSIHDQR